MLSDVLHDAARQIRDYQEGSPETYGPHKDTIDSILAHMDALRIELDKWPGPMPTAKDGTEIFDLGRYARWLSQDPSFHSGLEAPEGPFTCVFCPWGAKTREPYDDICNDPSEAHYLCPVLGAEVWGEDPVCGDHQTKLLRMIINDFASRAPSA